MYLVSRNEGDGDLDRLQRVIPEVSLEQFVGEIPIESDPLVVELAAIVGALACGSTVPNIVTLVRDHGPMTEGEIVGNLSGKAGVAGDVLRALELNGVMHVELRWPGVRVYSLRCTAD
jgi:hypothetical protein